jgi:hypothetical protein
MIAPLSLKGYASHFKYDPHDPLGFRIGIVVRGDKDFAALLIIPNPHAIPAAESGVIGVVSAGARSGRPFLSRTICSVLW